MANSQTDETAWMISYRSGDASAFARIYESYSGKLYGYLIKRTSSREEANEVFQACFLKFHQSRFKYDPSYPLEQWLYVIARTALIDHLRKAGRQVEIAREVRFDEVLTSELSPRSEEKTLEDLEIWEDIPPEQRKAIELRIVDELAYDQIARRLGKSQANVRQLVSRGLRKLYERARLRRV
jgi:RNA polymerase sigma factor (sigma-70 family)